MPRWPSSPLAGRRGRVDRIATAAPANQRAIYDYFANQEGLFDAARTRVSGDLIAAVPLREDDLPGYAADLFDYLRAHPAAVRRLAWRRLEHPDAGAPVADTFLKRMTAIRDHPGESNHQHAIDPVDLVILTIGLANAWDLSAPDLLPSRGQDPTDLRRIATHRAAVINSALRELARRHALADFDVLRDIDGTPDEVQSGRTARGGATPA